MTSPDDLRETVTNNYASPAELERWGREGVSSRELARPVLNEVGILVDMDSVNALTNRDGFDLGVEVDVPRD